MVLEAINDNRKRIVLVSAISAFAGAANIWMLALVSRNAHLSSIDSAGIAVFAAALISTVSISFLSQIMLSRLSARTFYQLREQLVNGITQLSSQQVEAIGRHRLYTALTKDVPAVHDLIIVLPNYVFNFTVVVACLIYLSTVSARLFLVFLSFLILALCVAKFGIVDHASKRFQVRRKVEDDLFKCYEAIIDGSKELKLNADREEAFVRGDLRVHAEKYRDATVAAELFWNMSNNWSTAVIFIAVGAVLFLSTYIGVLNRLFVITFVMVIFYMVGPLTILMNSFRTIQAAKIGADRLNGLHLDVAPPVRAAQQADGDDFRSLVISGMAFEYGATDEGREGFRVGPFDLEIGRGEIVYFVGGNGSGKTTAAKLITGLYGRQYGSIFVNGIEAIDHAAYMQRFSAIFQDYYLFDTLVPKVGAALDEKAVQSWVSKLQLADKVVVENGRLSTTKLSYGQRKRLALLVALFDGSDIYVFDEWAADQDQEFREFFYREFLGELKAMGKTAIVVSHDDRYFHLADKVVEFDDGKVVSMASSPRVRPEHEVHRETVHF
jgi:cyclic peptide transporter